MQTGLVPSTLCHRVLDTLSIPYRHAADLPDLCAWLPAGVVCGQQLAWMLIRHWHHSEACERVRVHDLGAPYGDVLAQPRQPSLLSAKR